MNQNEMFTFGLLPNKEIISVYTDKDGNLVNPPQGKLIPLVKKPKPNGHWTPVLIWLEDRVERSWDVAPEPPSPLTPDWDRFQTSLQSANGFPAAWSAIFSGDARPGIGLIAALAVWWATGQWEQFLGAALACLALLPPEQAAHVGLELLALATDCHLDPAFCQALKTFLEASS